MVLRLEKSYTIMNKWLKYIFMCLVSCFLSCKDDTVGAVQPELKINEEYLYLNFEQKSSFVHIPVETNLGLSDWSVSSDQNWCLVAQDKISSGIVVSVTSNEEPEVREANMTVKYALGTIDIHVQQLGYGPAILVAPLSSTAMDASGGELPIKVTSNISYKKGISEGCDWISEINSESPESRSLVDEMFVYNVERYVGIGGDRQAVISFTGEDYPDVKSECVVTQHPKDPSPDDVIPSGDIAFKPIGGQASQTQGGYDIENCWDDLGGDNIYHSPWSEPTQFPVTLEFDFDGTNTLDYFIYTPRATGDGQWGTFTVYAQTKENSAYIKIGDYDFGFATVSTKQELPKSVVNIVKLKFEITSGKNNFVNVEELGFYQNNEGSEEEKLLLNVFKDLTCSELRDDITYDDIKTLPGFFGVIADKLWNGTYDEWEKKFRIQEYKPYSDPKAISKELVIKEYTDLDNPTGIVVKAGEELVVLVGDTYDNLLVLQSVQDADLSGEKYILHEGINKLKIRKDGALYVMYTTDLNNPEKAKPVKIHIPLTGQVNGYFDLENDKTDAVYSDLLMKSTYKYFIIKGRNVLLNFHRSELLKFQPTSIVEYINTFDDIVNWEYELMFKDGKRPETFNNHVNASSLDTDGGYMWAGNGQIGFDSKTGLPVIMPVDQLKKNYWGPAHEIGHLHQNAINWTGCSESSNNIFSNYVAYKIGGESLDGTVCTNGSALYQLADRKYNKRPFANFLNDTKNEDKNLHMRMYWQLWLYFHKLGVNKDFYPNLFEGMRYWSKMTQDPGELQMRFVQCACEAAYMDLTEFFDAWGFLTPIDEIISDYGDKQYTVTQSMIDNLKSQMASRFGSNPKPAAFQYIEDRKNGEPGLKDLTDVYKDVEGKLGDVGHWTQFKNKDMITIVPAVSVSGQNVTVNGGDRDKAVAFEVWKDGELVYFSNMYSFTLPASLNTNGCTFKAVQADGERKVMTGN